MRKILNKKNSEKHLNSLLVNHGQSNPSTIFIINLKLFILSWMIYFYSFNVFISSLKRFALDKI